MQQKGIMKKKKYITLVSIVCAFSLLLGSLTSCKSDVVKVKLDPKNPVPIEIWNYYNGPQKIAFDQLITEFNDTIGQEQGIMVESFSQGSIPALIEKVTDAANKKVGAQSMPDIFASYADTAYVIDKLGQVAALDNYFTKEELDQYVAGYINEGRITEDGKLKIFPIAKSPEVFLLNKTDWDKFANATGTSLEELGTIEGITRVAEQYYQWTDSLTAAPNDGKAFFGRDALANYIIIGSKQLGHDIFTVSDGKVKIDCDPQVMRKLWDNFYVPYISGYFASNGKFRSDDAKVGTIISLVGSCSGATYFPTTVTVTDTEKYPIDVVAFPAPCFENSPLYAVQQGAGMVVTKSTPEKEYAACVFLKWFTQKEQNINFSLMSGYMPVKKEANNMQQIEQALQNQPDLQLSEILKTVLPVAVDTVSSHQFYVAPAFGNSSSARDILENTLTDKAKQDLQKVKALIQSGVAKADAINQVNTEDNFNQWLQQLQKDLEKAVTA